ncbi:spindle pole body interacting protein [Tilletiaria anomala UBC 951]|uniref:Spindle pole body interacting protein n=1 Tax=Tilletiaria anomala (strain ATCC 24038 / CBS 436.72 / UBC 951) TaxID=1037660 RepID=A0A066V6L5_TILAU|nr:spindle pole body interacting protein [Tilletiaria anomala UBC 951]KDN37377.1 spindle pole body interacting protein [Tilletiaria anomala UBC 951]
MNRPDVTPRAALRSISPGETSSTSGSIQSHSTDADTEVQGSADEYSATYSSSNASQTWPQVGESSRHTTQDSNASSAGSSSGSRQQPRRQHSLRKNNKGGNGKHCSFCLLAEFDIDKGSTLAYQYPEPTGHDTHVLAELMLPDGAHARHEDWTVFFLKPPNPQEKKRSAFDDYDSENNPTSRHPGPTRLSPPTPTEDLTFVLNLVRTKHDNTVRRGAMVKAMCIGTRHPYIQVFKPLLLVALDRYFSDPGPEHLERLYEAVNNLELSAMPNFTREERLVLRGSDRRDLFEERFLRPGLPPSEDGDSLNADADAEDEQHNASSKRKRSDASLALSLSALKSVNTDVTSPTSSSDDPPPSASQSLSSLGGSSSRGKKKDTRFYSTMAYYNKLPIPLHIPLTIFPEEIGDYSMIQLVQTFSGPASIPTGPQHPHLHSNGSLTHPIILLFNAMATQKRIIFLGHGQPANTVSSFVLAASALGSGCGVVFEGFAGRVFPYTNLTNLDDLEMVPAYIAGVTNPRFEDLHAWDVLFNIENGKVTVSKNIEPAPPMQPNPRPALSRSGSLSSSGGVGHIANSSSAGVGIDFGVKAGGSTMLSNRERSGTFAEAKQDAADNAFIEDILAAIQAHCGEDYVRQRFVEHAQNFARIVARHEEHFYGHTFIGPTSQPFLNGQLGSGALPYGDRDAELRDIQINAMRAEGWRGSYSYKMYREDEAQRVRTRSISGFDCPYQLGRLRRSKLLALGEAQIIFETLSRCVQTPTQIVELLSLLPSHSGGLTPLAFGVFHPSAAVRVSVLDLFTNIALHPVGCKLLHGLNAFVRLALARSLNARAEQGRSKQNGLWSSPTPTLARSRDGMPAFYNSNNHEASYLPKNWSSLLPPSSQASRSPSPASGISAS